MSDLQILVVDDEPLARENLRLMLADRPGCAIMGEAHDVASAEALLAQHHVDLLFLDIRMPGASGLELAARLQAPDAPVVVIVTAHQEFAVAAFGVRATDFLLKPFDEERLAAAIESAMLRHAERASHRRLASLGLLAKDLRDNPLELGGSGVESVFSGDRLVIRDARRTSYVPLDDVILCRAARNYIRVHVADRLYLLRCPLGKLSEQLDPRRFVRVHRTTIINIGHVVEVRPLVHGDYMIHLTNGARIRMSRRRRHAIARLVHGAAPGRQFTS